MSAPIPKMMYGTAWKEEQTAELTYMALKAGFRGIDTANQRKHYFEQGVGDGLLRFFEETNTDRDQIFIQTKYTYQAGQDHRLPYNPDDTYNKQVKDSFERSLVHLGVDTIDSYILHGPMFHDEICQEDLETWAAMEKLVDEHKVRFIGVSNFSATQLEHLCKHVRIKPSFVQNRCYARLGWDQQVRGVCKDFEMTYQGFSLLTANRQELSSDAVTQLAKRHQRTIPQLVFRFAHQLGMIPLTGTTSAQHMSEDLNIFDFELSPKDMELIENIHG